MQCCCSIATSNWCGNWKSNPWCPQKSCSNHGGSPAGSCWIVVPCVDDVIVFSKDDAEIEWVLQQFNNLNHDFLWNNTFSLCLGIQLQNLADGCIKLLQLHLKSSTINIMGLSKANPCTTPIAAPLFQCKGFLPFNQSFNCQSAMGILQCIGNTTHSECACAMSTCAHHCMSPWQAHGNVLNEIGHHPKGFLDDNLIINPKGDLSLDCCIDADSAGNQNAKKANDPATMWSCTGFVITLGSVPVLWKRVLQTEIMLSTVEAEHIVLSTAMHKLI